MFQRREQKRPQKRRQSRCTKITTLHPLVTRKTQTRASYHTSETRTHKKNKNSFGTAIGKKDPHFLCVRLSSGPVFWKNMNSN